MIPLFELSKLHAEMADEVDQAWQQVRQAGAFVVGEFVERFEAEWAEYCGARHCIGVGNGTDALELCLAALGIGRGDEVIVPANTFIATAEAVANVGATPVPEQAAEEIVSLPMYPHLGEEDIGRIAQGVEKVSSESDPALAS
jgi:dTDP-4-amino-4,6-dideoxygalactose transaminase